MIVYPAIDLRKGRCVRLQQGDAAAETVFADDPADAARRWASEGAEWLHVVNLDGALGETGAANLIALRRILAAVGLPVQFGGGLRSLEDIAALLELGVTRVVLGTVAVREPEIVQSAIERFGSERVAVGIDARAGLVAVQGWRDLSTVRAADLGLQMRVLGVERVIYTDIARDGMLTGVNVEATVALAQATGLGVIASGGVASLEDLVRLRATGSIEGVIIGQALYTGAVSLPEAICLCCC
jgi:phosphoribosylformimino-5-aminoimidazole carboxamide ribotide isomerase